MLHADTFPLPRGSDLPAIGQYPAGTVVGVTITTYKVQPVSGGDAVFVPFSRVHDFRPATPLVTFTG